jgi:hypothetical protein
LRIGTERWNVDTLVLGPVVVCGGIGDWGERSGAALIEGVSVGPDLIGGVGALAIVVAIGIVGVKGASSIDEPGGVIVRVVAVVGGGISIEGVGDVDDTGIVVEIVVAVAGSAIGVEVAAAAVVVVGGVGAFAGDGVGAQVRIASGAGKLARGGKQDFLAHSEGAQELTCLICPGLAR